MKVGHAVMLMGAVLLVTGLMLSAFAPHGPQQRIIFDGTYYQIVEDKPSGLICTIDKTGKHKPTCERADQQYIPSQAPSNDEPPLVGEGGMQ